MCARRGMRGACTEVVLGQGSPRKGSSSKGGDLVSPSLEGGRGREALGGETPRREGTRSRRPANGREGVGSPEEVEYCFVFCRFCLSASKPGDSVAASCVRNGACAHRGSCSVRDNGRGATYRMIDDQLLQSYSDLVPSLSSSWVAIKQISYPARPIGYRRCHCVPINLPLLVRPVPRRGVGETRRRAQPLRTRAMSIPLRKSATLLRCPAENHPHRRSQPARCRWHSHIPPSLTRSRSSTRRVRFVSPAMVVQHRCTRCRTVRRALPLARHASQDRKLGLSPRVIPI